MAQAGDTITYTYNDNTDENGNLVPQTEDITGIDKITIDYLDGAGGGQTGGAGGRVENASFDVSAFNTLYIWVGSVTVGRYDSTSGSQNGGGSTEVSISNTGPADSADEPFLAAAGGGGGGSGSGPFGDIPGGGGAREGVGSSSTDRSEGIAPPLGGAGGSGSGGDGQAAIDDENRGYTIDSGTAIEGGGSGENTDGEIQITYKSLSPDAPSNVQITDAQTKGELTVDWDAVGSATGYYVYRAESSGSAKSDYTQVADVTSPPYVDQNLEDGERYYYRVSAYN
jgi:hypothetical protein